MGLARVCGVGGRELCGVWEWGVAVMQGPVMQGAVVECGVREHKSGQSECGGWGMPCDTGCRGTVWLVWCVSHGCPSAQDVAGWFCLFLPRMSLWALHG